MNRDYLQEALHRFNTDKPNWYGWKKIDDDGNTIPNKDRMQHKYIKVIVDGVTIPSEAGKQKLKDLGLDDDEIKALIGI